MPVLSEVVARNSRARPSSWPLLLLIPPLLATVILVVTACVGIPMTPILGGYYRATHHADDSSYFDPPQHFIALSFVRPQNVEFWSFRVGCLGWCFGKEWKLTPHPPATFVGIEERKTWDP